jgi:hypothetical protein
MNKKCFLSFIVLISLFINTYSQDRTITGIITDYRGKPLGGVNIMAKDYPSLTTISGADGQFRLPVFKITKALIFSFADMKTKTVELSDLNNLLVIMDYLPGKNAHPWNILYSINIYRSDVYNQSKDSDSSWTNSGGPGFGASIEIEYFFSQKIGISTGIGFNSFTHKAWLSNFNNYGVNTVLRTDIDNETYYLYSRVNNLDEQITVKVISIPLKLKYRFKQGKKWDFFIDAGVKFLMTKEARVKATGQSTWQGYYPQYHIVLYDLPEYGFINYNFDIDNNIENHSKFMTSFTSSIGVSKSIGKKSSFDISIFFEQSLSDLKYKQPVYPADFLNTVGTVDKTKLRGLGLVLGFRHNFVKSK